MTKLILPSHLAQSVSDSSSRALLCTTMYADSYLRMPKSKGLLDHVSKSQTQDQAETAFGAEN